MAQVITDLPMKQSTLISTKKMSILVSSFYLFSAAGSALKHAPQVLRPESAPLVKGIGYLACIFFFLLIQRETKNVFEKLMAFASASVFILQLVRLVCAEFQIIAPHLFTLSYSDTALIVIATIAIIARTIELFIPNHEGPRQTVS
jgi:hypothetical protein